MSGNRGTKRWVAHPWSQSKTSVDLGLSQVCVSRPGYWAARSEAFGVKKDKQTPGHWFLQRSICSKETEVKLQKDKDLRTGRWAGFGRGWTQNQKTRTSPHGARGAGDSSAAVCSRSEEDMWPSLCSVGTGHAVDFQLIGEISYQE